MWQHNFQLPEALLHDGLNLRVVHCKSAYMSSQSCDAVGLSTAKSKYCTNNCFFVTIGYISTTNYHVWKKLVAIRSIGPVSLQFTLGERYADPSGCDNSQHAVVVCFVILRKFASLRYNVSDGVPFEIDFISNSKNLCYSTTVLDGLLYLNVGLVHGV